MTLQNVFHLVIETTIYGSIVGVILLLFKHLFAKKLSAKWQYLIWMILILKLIIPFGPESSISIFNTVKPPIIITQDGTVNTTIFSKSYTYTLSPNDVIKTPEGKQAFDFLGALPFIWLIGMMGLFFWLVLTNLLLRYKLYKNTLETSDRINKILSGCMKKLDIERNIELVTQNYILAPSLFSIIKPKILITPNLESMSDKQIEYTLLHELSHYKRKDILVNYILLLLQCMHFFNPVIWYCFKKIRQDMEIATDEQTMLYIENNEYKAYGLALIATLEGFRKNAFAPKLLGLVSGEKDIEKRIRIISKFKKPKFIWSIVAILIISLTGLLCLTNAQTLGIAPKEESKIISEAKKEVYDGIEIKITADKISISDILGIINELNAGGAKYITLNGDKVDATSVIPNDLFDTKQFIISAMGISNNDSLYTFALRESGILNYLKSLGFTVEVTKFTQEKQFEITHNDTSFIKNKYSVITLNNQNGNIVHDSDILMLKNELYLCAAKGISINDIPVVGNTYFACEDEIFIDGKQISAPYTIKAYGDLDKIAFTQSNIIATLARLGIDITIDDIKVVSDKISENEEENIISTPTPEILNVDDNKVTPTPSSASTNVPVPTVTPGEVTQAETPTPSYHMGEMTIEEFSQPMNLENVMKISGYKPSGSGTIDLKKFSKSFEYNFDNDVSYKFTVYPNENGEISIYFDTDFPTVVANINISAKERNGKGWGYGMPTNKQQSYHFYGFDTGKEYDVEISQYYPGGYNIIGKALIY